MSVLNPKTGKWDTLPTVDCPGLSKPAGYNTKSNPYHISFFQWGYKNVDSNSIEYFFLCPSIVIVYMLAPNTNIYDFQLQTE